MEQSVRPTKTEFLNRKVKVKLTFPEGENVYCDQFISLLKYLEIINDLGVVTVDKKYEKINIDKYFYYKSARPIEKNQRFIITEVSKKSPLSLTVVLASLGGLWILIQIIDKIANWRLNRQKLRLEVEKLIIENQNNQQQGRELDDYLEYLNENPEVQRRLGRIQRELEENQMNLEDFDIYL
jgi:hypothetical protein